MTNHYEIVASFLVALVITVLFSQVLKNKGPWGAVWLVFLTIFLASWAGYLWINPFGPLVLGVSVAPIFVVGLIIAFILAAVTMPAPRRNSTANETAVNDETKIALGVFFWIVMALLLVAIAAGYYRIPINSHQIIR
jgi:amino acid transporter